MKAVTSPYVTPGWVITPGIVEWTIQILGNLWTPITLLFIANFKQCLFLVNRFNRTRKIKWDVRHSCERIDELIVQWCIQWNKGCLMKTYFWKLFLTKFLENRDHLSPRFMDLKNKMSGIGKSKISLTFWKKVVQIKHKLHILIKLVRTARSHYSDRQQWQWSCEREQSERSEGFQSSVICWKTQRCSFYSFPL